MNNKPPEIRFACPYCQGHILTEQAGAGQTVPCPHCNREIVVPDKSNVDDVADLTLEENDKSETVPETPSHYREDIQPSTSAPNPAARPSKALGYIVAGVITVPLMVVFMIATARPGGQMPMWANFIAFVVFFGIANAINSTVNRGRKYQTKQGQEVEIPIVRDEHTASVPQTGQPPIARRAGRQMDAKFVITESEMQAIQANSDAFDNVLTFVITEGDGGMQTRHNWYLVLQQRKGIAFCTSLNQAWPFTNNNVTLSEKEVSIQLADGRNESFAFDAQNADNAVCLRAWKSNSFQEYQNTEARGGPNSLCGWGLFAWILATKKDPTAWLSWVLPYQKVADGVAGLLADKSNCPTFIQALVKHADRKRVWKVVENLKALSTEASRQLLRQLLTAMRTEYRPHWVAPYVLLVFPLIPIAIWIASFVNTPRTVPFGRGPDDMFYLGMVGFFVALLGLPSLITFCIALSGRAKLRRIAETETALRL